MRNNIIGILMISALAGSAHAAPPAVLTACGALSSPGSYVLANDVLTPASGVCFLITADVNLKMDGHSITAGPADAGVIRVGVRVTASAAGTRIQDGSIVGLETAPLNSGIGIRVESASGVRVTGMTITGNHIGVYIIQADGNRFDGNNVSNNSDVGFQVDSGSDNNTFIGNQCDQNGSPGVGGCIFLANNTGNLVMSNTMNNNTVDGVIVSAGSSAANEIRNNVINGGLRGVALFITTGNTVRNNTITGANVGISLAATATANIISNNIVNGSASFDILDLGTVCDDTYKNNTFTTSSGPAGCIQ